MIGDVNKDGMITAVDASRILYLYAEINAGNVQPTAEDMYICDVNRDSKINSTDASICLVFYAELNAGYKENFVTYLTKVLKITIV